jgi:hypothetical protein
LLTSQLESQRQFFEERMLNIEERYKLQIIDLEAKSKIRETENVQLKETVKQLNIEKTALDKKCSTVNTFFNYILLFFRQLKAPR